MASVLGGTSSEGVVRRQVNLLLHGRKVHLTEVITNRAGGTTLRVLIGGIEELSPDGDWVPLAMLMRDADGIMNEVISAISKQYHPIPTFTY